MDGHTTPLSTVTCCTKCATYYLSKAPRQGPLQQMLVGAPFERYLWISLGLIQKARKATFS